MSETVNEASEKDVVKTPPQGATGSAEPVDGSATVPDLEEDAAVAEPQEEVAAMASGADEDSDALPSEESDAPAVEKDGEPSIEELVERKVAEKVSAVLPQELEPPRLHSPRDELSASDYLRLGYGSKSPHV